MRSKVLLFLAPTLSTSTAPTFFCISMLVAVIMVVVMLMIMFVVMVIMTVMMMVAVTVVVNVLVTEHFLLFIVLVMVMAVFVATSMTVIMALFFVTVIVEQKHANKVYDKATDTCVQDQVYLFDWLRLNILIYDLSKQEEGD